MSFSVCPVGCWCDRCQRLSLASLQALLSVQAPGYSDYYKTDRGFYERVMTAEDLGLPLSQWTSRWLTAMYGAPLDFKPPYHFWLGAVAT